jgi:hypothetical protein
VHCATKNDVIQLNPPDLTVQGFIFKQGEQKFWKKITHFFQKVAQKVSKPKKCQNVYNKAQIESLFLL